VVFQRFMVYIKPFARVAPSRQFSFRHKQCKFHYRRAAFSSILKSKCGSILVKSADLP
jgi:hypothetical protein